MILQKRMLKEQENDDMEGNGYEDHIEVTRGSSSEAVDGFNEDIPWREKNIFDVDDI